MFLDQEFRPAAAALDDFIPAEKDVFKMSVLTAVERLQFTNWRRRSL